MTSANKGGSVLARARRPRIVGRPSVVAAAARARRSRLHWRNELFWDRRHPRECDFCGLL